MAVDANTFLFRNLQIKDPKVGSFILGVGQVHQCSENGTNVLKVDVNPQKVAQSFAPLQEKFRKELVNKIKQFYDKDKNIYQTPNGESLKFNNTSKISPSSFVFKIFVETTALGKSSFTYLYKYQMSFNDGNFEIHMTNFLSSLKEDVKNFGVQLAVNCNRFISSTGKKREKDDLKLDKAIQLINDYELDTLQRHAPVLSCVKGKFNLANVDLREIKAKTLWNRSKNMDGTDNPEVFQKYCDGVCDEEIRAAYGFSNLDLFAEKHWGRRGLWGVGIGKAIASGALYGLGSVDILGGPTLSVGVANDFSTLTFNRDLLNSTTLSDAIITSRKWKSDSRKANIIRSVDSVFSKILAVVDIGVNVYSKATGKSFLSTITGGIGAVYQISASIWDTKNQDGGKKMSIPQAIYDLTEWDMAKYYLSAFSSRDGKPDVSGWTDEEGNVIMNYNTDGSSRSRICTESLKDSDFGIGKATFDTWGTGRYGGGLRGKKK